MRTAQLSTVLHSRKLLVVLCAVVALAVAGTTLGYASLSKSVTLTLDGKSSEVSALGGTVEEVLAAEGVEVGEHDVVAPALDSSVDDGTAITVAFARPLDLTVDGESSKHWVTATDVDGALSQIGRRFSGADLSTSRSTSIRRDGLELAVVTPKTVKVAVGGKKAKKVEVPALTVADALEEMDVKYDDDDKVSPKPGKKIESGDRITVTKVKVERKKVAGERIAFGTVRRNDGSMTAGRTKVVKPGKPGKRAVTYELRYENGTLKSRKVVSSDVVRAPVKQVVKVGTKKAPAPAPVKANYASGNSVWDALAKCESGGNWATNTGNGYYGGLQFNPNTWRSVGGTGLPHQHSREEQIKRGKILQARAGWGQWPHCTSKLGLR
ncbi:resuscitation-promoting factor [Nocardioides gilvus]|uniref:resuscitation-promoting factor n=1 Tax=Nocardioides gilvus TaxID=1735589 RepID=UPI0013A56E1E|nr:resuscitation-promoting factor [Nocardioides gilvus]